MYGFGKNNGEFCVCSVFYNFRYYILCKWELF